MYRIEQKLYGCKLTFGGHIQAPEMQKWLDESKKILPKMPKDFKVFVDMRKLNPLPPDSQIIMENGQKLFKQKGMQRSVVILDNVVTKMQFRKIAKDTGIYEWERYISASDTPDWEEKGISWLERAEDPE